MQEEGGYSGFGYIRFGPNSLTNLTRVQIALGTILLVRRRSEFTHLFLLGELPGSWYHPTNAAPPRKSETFPCKLNADRPQLEFSGKVRLSCISWLTYMHTSYIDPSEFGRFGIRA
ncbi:hypothetical protein EV1_038306 [Malus domestica]